MNKFNGTWTLVGKDVNGNLDAFMINLGMNWMKRKIGARVNREITFNVTGTDSFYSDVKYGETSKDF